MDKVDTRCTYRAGCPCHTWGISFTFRMVATNYRTCKICGHPYDHNGVAHSKYEVARARKHLPLTKPGECITGPDGTLYVWTGQQWTPDPRKLP